MKVNGDEFIFPGIARQGGLPPPPSAIFGNTSSVWWGGNSDYPANFNGINIDESTVSLKTVLTVEPDIIGTPNDPGYDANGLATDPYRYIKVEGRINE